MENKGRKSTLSELPTALFKSKLVLIAFGLFLSSQFSLQETIRGQPSNLVFGSVSLGLVNKTEHFNFYVFFLFTILQSLHGGKYLSLDISHYFSERVLNA